MAKFVQNNLAFRNNQKILMGNSSQVELVFDGSDLAISTSVGDLTLQGDNVTLGASGLSLEFGSTINEFSTDPSFGDDSDNAVPTESAIKGYVDSRVSTSNDILLPQDSINFANNYLKGSYRLNVLDWEIKSTPTFTVGDISSTAWQPATPLQNGNVAVFYTKTPAYTLHMTIVDKDGAVVVSPFEISPTGTGGAPHVCTLANGNIAWAAVRNQEQYYGIVKPNGDIDTTSTAIIGTTFVEGAGCGIAALANGNFVITWYDRIASDNGPLDFQIFNPDGTPFSGILNAYTSTKDEGQSVSVTALTNGGFVIKFFDDSSLVRTGFIILNANGEVVAGPVHTPEFDVNMQLNSYDDVLCLPNGNIVFIGFSINGYFKIYDKDAVEVKALTTYSGGSTTSKAAGVILPDGNFMIVYAISGNTLNAYFTVLDQDGNVVNGPGTQFSSTMLTGDYYTALLHNGTTMVFNVKNTKAYILGGTGTSIASDLTVQDGKIDIGTDDSAKGTLNIFSSSGSSGEINLYNDPNYDSSINFYTVRTDEDDLWIGPATDSDALAYDGGTNQWVLSAAGGTHITAGNLWVGVLDQTIGIITCYGAGAGSADGGRVVVGTAPDYDTNINSYALWVDEDDLLFGPSSDTDSLKFVAGGSTGQWHFTGSQGVVFGQEDAAADSNAKLYLKASNTVDGPLIIMDTPPSYDTTITSYTIKVNEDDLQIGPATDPDALKYDGGTNQWIFNPTLGNNSVRIGVDGDPSSGELHLEGSNTDEGGRIALYTGTGFDTVIASYHVLVSEDDLNIGPGTDIDALKYDGANNVWQFTRSETRFGTEDSAGAAGILVVYGNNSNAGGEIHLHTGAPYDTTISRYEIGVRNDDLEIGPSTDSNALKYVGATGGWEVSHNGSLVLSTDTTGIVVVGSVRANDLIVDGNSIQLGDTLLTEEASGGLSVAGNIDASGQLAAGNDSLIIEGAGVMIRHDFDLAASSQGVYIGVENFANMDIPFTGTSGLTIAVQQNISTLHNLLTGANVTVNLATDSATVTEQTAVKGTCFLVGDNSTITTARGGYFIVDVVTSMVGATMNTAVAGEFHLLLDGSGDVSIDDGYGVLIKSPGLNPTGTTTNLYGLYIEDQLPGGFTNTYNLYSAGVTSKNKFEGNVEIDGSLTVNGNFESESVPSLILPQDVRFNSIESMKGGHRIDSDDFSVGSATHLIGAARDMGATALRNGNFAVSFSDTSSDFPRLRIYDPDGNQVISEVLIKSSTSAGTQCDTLQNGNIVVALNDSGATQGSFVIYDQEGNLLVSEVVIVDTQPQGNSLKVFSLANGGFGFTWVENTTEGYLAIYDENGAVVKATTKFTDTDLTGNLPDGIGLKNGNFMLAWGDDSTDASFYAIFDSSGDPVVTEEILDTGYSNHLDYNLVLLNSGNVMILFTGGASAGVWAAVVSQEGTIVESARGVVTTGTNVNPAGAVLPNGNVFVVNEDPPLTARWSVLDAQANVVQAAQQFAGGPDYAASDPLFNPVTLNNGKVAAVYAALSDESGFKFIQSDGLVVDGTLTANDLILDATSSTIVIGSTVLSEEVGGGLAVAGIVSASEPVSGSDLATKNYADTKTDGWTYSDATSTVFGTLIELTDGIPSDAQEIEILFNGVSTSTNSQPPIIQLGDAGGVETAGYSGVITGPTGSDVVTDGFYGFRTTGWADGDALTGIMRLARWSPDEDTWFGEGVANDGAGTSTYTGTKTTSGSVISIWLTTPGGAATFDLGSIRLRYR